MATFITNFDAEDVAFMQAHGSTIPDTPSAAEAAQAFDNMFEETNEALNKLFEETWRAENE